MMTEINNLLALRFGVEEKYKKNSVWSVYSWGHIPAREEYYMIITPRSNNTLTKESCRVFFMKEDKVYESTVEKVDYFRDGGSVSVTTIEGNFFFPIQKSENLSFSFGSGEVVSFDDILRF